MGKTYQWAVSLYRSGLCGRRGGSGYKYVCFVFTANPDSEDDPLHSIMDKQLFSHPAFMTRAEFLSIDERVALAYQRAVAVLKAWGTYVRMERHSRRSHHRSRRL